MKIPIILILILTITGCTPEEIIINAGDQLKELHEVSTASAQPAPASNDTIKIASFNIQVFGKSKAEKPEVMEILAKTIHQFDIVAIQEIRDKSGTAIEALEAEVDKLGTDYDYIIGPRLGRTSSKEQYAYMYRTDRLEPVMSYTWNTTHSLVHRAPFIAEFKTKPEGFDFIIAQIHTDPDEAEHEISTFGVLITVLREKHKDQGDFIAVGDFNADCSYFDESKDWELGWSGYDFEFEWLITNDMDTNLARSSCTYDRIIITKDTTVEDWTGQAGVYRFDEIHSLTNDQAKKVSDHYPVWATFHTNKDTD